MPDEQFLVSLEFAISRALAHALEKEWRSYWCDGILKPESSDLATDMHGNKGFETIAFLPKGQYENKEYRFVMNIWFGPESERYYSNGQSLENTIPVLAPEEWIYLDIPARRIEVQLS